MRCYTEMTNTEGKAKSSVLILHTLEVIGMTRLHLSKSSTGEVISHFLLPAVGWEIYKRGCLSFIQKICFLKAFDLYSVLP